MRLKGVGIAQDTFGWVCDGAILNATRGFAMIAVAIYAASGRWQREVPSEVVSFLSNIKVKYIKFSNTQSRVVAGLVDSAINSKTNRSLEDPFFLQTNFSVLLSGRPAESKQRCRCTKPVC